MTYCNMLHAVGHMRLSSPNSNSKTLLLKGRHLEPSTDFLDLAASCFGDIFLRQEQEASRDRGKV